MKKRWIALTLAMMMLLATALPAAAAETDAPIVILHTNDVHGAIDGYAAVAALKDAYEAQGAYVLLLDAGDFIQGDSTVSIRQGETAVELMNLAGYDAVVPGNHEFDYGYARLSELVEQAAFPVTAANLIREGAHPFSTHLVFDAPNGMKIGVFGIVTPDATATNPEKIRGLSFLAGKELYASARTAVRALEDAGCDVIVCLAHLGITAMFEPNRSIDLLAQVEGIDVLIDGHSHSTPEEIAAELGGTAAVGQGLLVSAGEKLGAVGVLQISAAGEITADSVSLADFAQADTEVAARAAEIRQQIDAEYGIVFARSEVDLNGAREPGNRTEETNFGDLIADAMRWGAAQNGFAADAAIVNGGSVRAGVAIGDVTRRDIKTVLPFGNTLCVIRVTGTELLEALEAACCFLPEQCGAFAQVSGLEYSVDITKPYDRGEPYPGSTYFAPATIRRVTIHSVGGKAFDPAAVYTIAVSDFVAAGGDSYYAFAQASEQYDLGLLLDEVVVDYIDKALGGVIRQADYGAPAGRVTILPGKTDDAPVAPEVPAAPDDAPGCYIVQEGDCLWNISHRLYGQGSLWARIFEANRDRIRQPSLIHIGQELAIPAA